MIFLTMPPHNALGSRLLAVLLWLAIGNAAQAQWLTQSFILKPGWNAIFAHVDASYQSLDALVPDANGPVAEVWLWKPTFSTIQFVDSPYSNAVPNSQWAVWTSARGDTDTLTKLVGNGGYLVKNRTTTDFTWTVKGNPVPPSYQWTTTGLNFLGFPTPEVTALNFAAFLTPAPGLDLANSLENQAHLFRYPGGDLGVANPTEIPSVTASTTPVTRGLAYWVRGSPDYYNHYYGPVEVTLQNAAGIQYRDTLGTYSLRLKNLTTSSRTVALKLLHSELRPAGQQDIVDVPPLLVRGALSPTTLTYDSAVLADQQFTLAPQGQVGSEVQVVLGLNRSTMTNAAGSLYAGVLRITDTEGFQQIDVPVSATVPSASGLWVGQANINQVGQYLKTYPEADLTKSDQISEINQVAALAGRPPNGAEIPGADWVPRETSFSRTYSAVASSLDGRRLVAASSGGALYVSQDYGTNWTTRLQDANGKWSALACSADGSVMAASVNQGGVYVSSDSGTNWTNWTVGTVGTNSSLWVGIACSADGNRLAALVAKGQLYTSTNRGTNFVAQSGAGTNRNWSSLAMSADGSRLVAAVNPGQLYTSSDSGVSWTAGETNRAWSAVASSADGTKLFAAVLGGSLYTSTDAGVTWTPRATANSWTSAASSTDGQRLAATVDNGQIYTSDDAGVNWVARDQNRKWDAIAGSGDATRLVAVVNGGGAIYTLSRTYASYTVDQTTGHVLDQNGLYLSSATNTALAKVAREFPLRLILHFSTANQVSLLQHVYVGQGSTTTNTVIASRESFLDASQLASARRITAAHLPFSRTNVPWSASGTFNPGSVVTFNVVESYKDQTSNPFLHTFHPDHDNLSVDFKTVRPRGEESYDITRVISLTFSIPAGTDFTSLTASALSRSGTYEETLTIGAQGSANRDFRFSGSFTLRLISPIATLTTQ